MPFYEQGQLGVHLCAHAHMRVIDLLKVTQLSTTDPPPKVSPAPSLEFSKIELQGGLYKQLPEKRR